MPYLACLPRLSFMPATAQQFRRSTYLNPLESPHNINYFTGLSFLKARLWIACRSRQTAQSRVFKSYLLEPNRAQFSLTFVWLPFTFQRPNHCLAHQPYHDLRRRLSGTTIHKNDQSAVYPHFSGISGFTLSQSHHTFHISGCNISNFFALHNPGNLLHTFLHINTHLLFSLVQIYRPPVQPGSSVRKTLQSS